MPFSFLEFLVGPFFFVDCGGFLGLPSIGRALICSPVSSVRHVLCANPDRGRSAVGSQNLFDPSNFFGSVSGNC